MMFARMPAMKYLIILFSLLTPFISLAAVSNISQIVFVSEPQVVAPGDISKVLTIQTQSTDGLLETIDETSDLTVSTDSATGEFNSNSTTWNPNTTFTMSKNTGNKNFYYKDSTEGTFTITATLTTRTTGKSWTTSQLIKIGEGEAPGGSGGETETTATSTSKNVSQSTHLSQDELSDLALPKDKLKITIGRDRTVFVGVPVHFEAHDNMFDTPESSRAMYYWSFGDGGATRGAGATHIYMYAGDYNVVVNGEFKNDKSTTRIKVTVLTPDLIINKVEDGSVSIKNKASTEVNLSGYGLISQDQKYIFPTDTIISAGKTIIFPKEYIKLYYQGSEIWLFDYLGRKLFSLIP